MKQFNRVLLTWFGFISQMFTVFEKKIDFLLKLHASQQHAKIA